MNKEYLVLDKGYTSDIIDMGNGQICKLYKKEYGYINAKKEFDNICLLVNNKLDINIPKVEKLINVNDRWGIVQEKADGLSLLHLMQNNCVTKENVINIIINVQQSFWNCNISNLDSFIYCMNDCNMDRTKIEKIDKKYKHCVIHGDIHPGNILLKTSGQLTVVDFLTLSHGPKEYDVAKTFFLLKKRDSLLAEMYLHQLNMQNQDVYAFIEYLAVL